MSGDCIFCSIVDGEIPSHTVYEDDTVLAFLDANPLARGHTLVIPKAHHSQLQELPDGDATGLHEVLHDLVGTVEEAVDAEGSNVGLNNGPASGQEIPHVHYHIVPRFEGDGGNPIHAVGGTAPDLDDDELAVVAADIASD
jgi:histidine triad (HIT) family protein